VTESELALVEAGGRIEPTSGELIASGYHASPRERVRTRREKLSSRARPNRVEPIQLPMDKSNPCDGYFLAAEQFLELAIKAKTDEDLQRFSELADSFETAGQACLELKHTL
jgi:hypothetical protein